MLGGVVLRHFRLPGPYHRLGNVSWPRRSSLAVFAAYSQKSQFIVSVAPTLNLQGETLERGSRRAPCDVLPQCYQERLRRGIAGHGESNLYISIGEVF